MLAAPNRATEEAQGGFLHLAVRARSSTGPFAIQSAERASTTRMLHLLAQLPVISRQTSVSLHKKATVVARDSGWSTVQHHLEHFHIDDYIVDFKDGNAIQVALRGINIKAAIDFTYRTRAFPHIPSGGGHVDFEMSGNSFITTDIVLSVVDGRPYIAFDNTGFSLGKFKFHISDSGADWLYNLLSDLANGKITGAIKKAVKDAINEASTDINKMIGNINTTFPLPVPEPFNVAELNYSFTGIEIADGYASFAIRGSVDPLDPSKSLRRDVYNAPC